MPVIDLANPTRFLNFVNRVLAVVDRSNARFFLSSASIA